MTFSRHPPTDRQTLIAVLRWHLDAGVDETVGDVAVDRFRAPPAPPPVPQPAARAPSPPQPAPPPPPTAPAEAAVSDAVERAAAAATVDALQEALAAFDGCSLKRTATNLVFGRGTAAARLVLVGEAPGAEEDRQGLPFVGPSGKLLDRMLASVGLDESDVFITNTIFWRPPGNRDPTTNEVAACLPFLERLIELIDPTLLIALGGPAAKILTGRAESVGKLRGHWYDYQTPGLSRPIPTTATYHPAYLLRSPAQKRQAWRDMLAIRARLQGA